MSRRLFPGSSSSMTKTQVAQLQAKGDRRNLSVMAWKCTIPSPTSWPALQISPLPVAEFQHQRSMVGYTCSVAKAETARSVRMRRMTSTWYLASDVADANRTPRPRIGCGAWADPRHQWESDSRQFTEQSARSVYIPPEQSTSNPGYPPRQQDKAGQ